MRKHRKLLVVAGSLVAVTLLVALSSAQREPVHQGRPLHEWVAIYASPEAYGPGAEADAERALRQIGPKATPLLLKWIAFQPRPSRTKQLASTAMAMLPLAKNLPAVRRWLHSDELRHGRADAAVSAFDVLGPSASPAIPELARLAALSADPGPARRALDALASIGPLAFPAVVAVVTNQQAEGRFYAIIALQSFGTNARPAIPILIACLTNSALASAASETLGNLKLEPHLVVRALTKIAQKADPMSQSWAISTLSDYGRDALAAVPALLPFLSSTNIMLRKDATNALQAIAPQLLINAPPE